MGRYLTPATLREQLPGDWIEEYLGTDPVVDGGTGRITGNQPATDAQLEPFIKAAEDEADSYIGVAYPLPLSVVPGVLLPFVADLVRYRISKDNPTESIRKRYEDAVAFLRQVASGRASLGVVASEAPVAVARAASRPATKRMTRERLASWGL